MSGVESAGAGSVAFFKLYGFKVGVGMIGAALLYFVLPPVDANGHFDRREFVVRLACAGVFSSFFGDLGVDLIQHAVPFIQWSKHTGAVYLLTGAPAWWASRAFALMVQNRKSLDLVQLWKEFRALKNEADGAK